MGRLGVVTIGLLVATPCLGEEAAPVVPATTPPTTIAYRPLRGLEGMPMGVPGFGVPGPTPPKEKPGETDAPPADR